jgi:hypothetical protein
MKYLLLIILISNILYGFDEIKFIKKVNPKISHSKAMFIKNSIDRYFYLIESDFDKETLYRIAGNESRFKHKTISKTKDHGLFQINRYTYLSLCKQNIIRYNWKKIYTIEHNTEVAIILLKEKIKEVKRNFPKMNKKRFSWLVSISYNKGLKQLMEDFYEDKRYDLENYKYIRKLRRL